MSLRGNVRSRVQLPTVNEQQISQLGGRITSLEQAPPAGLTVPDVQSVITGRTQPTVPLAQRLATGVDVAGLVTGVNANRADVVGLRTDLARTIRGLNNNFDDINRISDPLKGPGIKVRLNDLAGEDVRIEGKADLALLAIGTSATPPSILGRLSALEAIALGGAAQLTASQLIGLVDQRIGASALLLGLSGPKINLPSRDKPIASARAAALGNQFVGLGGSLRIDLSNMIALRNTGGIAGPLGTLGANIRAARAAWTTVENAFASAGLVIASAGSGDLGRALLGAASLAGQLVQGVATSITRIIDALTRIFSHMGFAEGIFDTMSTTFGNLKSNFDTLGTRL